MRQVITYGYVTFDGRAMSNQAVDSYNRLQERINAFANAGLPVPEYLANGSFHIMQCHILAGEKK